MSWPDKSSRGAAAYSPGDCQPHHQGGDSGGAGESPGETPSGPYIFILPPRGTQPFARVADPDLYLPVLCLLGTVPVGDETTSKIWTLVLQQKIQDIGESS